VGVVMYVEVMVDVEVDDRGTEVSATVDWGESCVCITGLRQPVEKQRIIKIKRTVRNVLKCIRNC
jgi:hypothetical protein